MSDNSTNFLAVLISFALIIAVVAIGVLNVPTINNETARELRLQEAYLQGQKAFQDGRPIQSNAYLNESDEGRSWTRGYKDAELMTND